MTNEDKDRLSNWIDDEANEGRGFPAERETSSPPGPVVETDRQKLKRELFKKLYSPETIEDERASIRAEGEGMLVPEGQIYGTDPERFDPEAGASAPDANRHETQTGGVVPPAHWKSEDIERFVLGVERSKQVALTLLELRKSATTVQDELNKKYFTDGYEAGKHDALDEAESRVRKYMTGHFSTATMEAVIEALRGTVEL
jgi:hypothetical protein